VHTKSTITYSICSQHFRGPGRPGKLADNLLARYAVQRMECCQLRESPFFISVNPSTTLTCFSRKTNRRIQRVVFVHLLCFMVREVKRKGKERKRKSRRIEAVMALHTCSTSPLETVSAAGVGLDAHNPGTLDSAFQIHQENTQEAQLVSLHIGAACSCFLGPHHTTFHQHCQRTNLLSFCLFSPRWMSVTNDGPIRSVALSFPLLPRPANIEFIAREV
jgi:hypothetical protein